MTTLFLDCSPKKKRSTSAYLARHLKFMTHGKKESVKLIKKNYDAIIERLASVDCLVLSTPMYVDGIPSSLLEFLCLVHQSKIVRAKPLKVYAISNCGFYEGRQNKNSLAILENWCARCGFEYMGGLGLGAGEMFGIVRFFNPILALIIGGIQFITSSIIMLANSYYNIMEALGAISYINLAVNVLLIFVFNIFMYHHMIRLSRYVNKQAKTENKYSTVFCPRFLFVIFADLFWLIRAMLKGVPFWRLYAKPAQSDPIK